MERDCLQLYTVTCVVEQYLPGSLCVTSHQIFIHCASYSLIPSPGTIASMAPRASMVQVKRSPLPPPPSPVADKKPRTTANRRAPQPPTDIDDPADEQQDPETHDAQDDEALANQIKMVLQEVRSTLLNLSLLISLRTSSALR